MRRNDECTIGSRRRARSRARWRAGVVAATCAAALVATVTSVAPATAQDGSGTTLTVGVIQDVDSLNPTAGFLVSSFEVWNLQYATLTEKAADDFATVPGLAESWDVSGDGLTVTYTLREGLQWSDGTPLTADDVVWNINTSRDQEWINHYATTANLDAVALDDRTVEVTSSVPDPRLPSLDVYLLPPHVWEPLAEDDVTTYPAEDGVGSGPFTLESRRAGQSWTMVANDSYWGGRPAVDRIVFRVFTNPDAMVAALRAGEIDAAQGVPPSSFATLEADPDIEAVAGLQGSFEELAMNGMAGGLGDGHPALQDLTVRRAIAHAIDRPTLVERVLLGLGEPGVTMPVSPDGSWQPELTSEQRFDFDPDRARQLLDDAGYLDADGDGVREMPGGGQPLVFRYAERSESTNAAAVREFVTGWLDDIGIGTVVSVYDDTQLTDVVASGEYDLFVWGWVPYVDPDPQLSYFICDNLTTDLDDIGFNDANWCDPRYDELYLRQQTELDRDARVAIVHDMLRLFHDEGTYVVLYEDADLQAYRTDRFEGWVRQPADSGPVMFTNSSPSYERLVPVEGAEGGGGLGAVGIVAIVAGAVVVLGGGAFLVARSRAGRDDRE